jgi:hypothetical protein
MVNKTLTIWHKASGKALLTSDEAWRIAANIAKLPGLTAEITKSRIQGPADALMFLTGKLESKALKEGAVTFSSVYYGYSNWPATSVKFTMGMSAWGHERPDRAGRKFGYVRYGPTATKFFSASGMSR